MNELLSTRRELGHTTNIGGWRFVIHYTDCFWYCQRSEPRNRQAPISPGMRLVVCGQCRPPEELVSPYLKTVVIYVNSHGGIGRLSQQRAIGS